MPYACASGNSTSSICLASSRVGASTRARGRGRLVAALPPALPRRSASRSMAAISCSLAPRRATSGMEKASVLPEPVRPRPRMSRPARESGRVSAWMGKAVRLPSLASTCAKAPGTPSSVKVGAAPFTMLCSEYSEEISILGTVAFRSGIAPFAQTTLPYPMASTFGTLTYVVPVIQ